MARKRKRKTKRKYVFTAARRRALKRAQRALRAKSRSRKRPIKRRKRSKIKKRRTIMARRYRRKRRTKRYTQAKTLAKELVPIGAAVIAEPIIDNLTSSFLGSWISPIGNVQMDDLAKVGLGWYFGRKKGMLGKAMFYVGVFGARNIISQLIPSNLFQGAVAGGVSGSTQQGDF